MLEVWQLLHNVLLDHAYASAPDRPAPGDPPALPTPRAYSIARLRDDFRRHFQAGFVIVYGVFGCTVVPLHRNLCTAPSPTPTHATAPAPILSHLRSHSHSH